MKKIRLYSKSPMLNNCPNSFNICFFISLVSSFAIIKQTNYENAIAMRIEE